MRISRLAVALVTTVCLSLPSYAATLQSVAGKVSINSGAGYKAASSGNKVNVGDVVMASPGARAQLIYPDGCKVPVNPGAVMTIQAESPCAGAYAQVFPQCLPGDLRWECNGGAYVFGGLSVAIIGAGIYNALQNKDGGGPVFTKPASP